MKPPRSLLIGALFLMPLLPISCVGSPVHETLKYNSIQNRIGNNNDTLLQLRIGMAQDEVLEVMGKPERSEGYSWGSAWLYRTAMTSGVYGTEDSDFTPVVFDPAGAVSGWGRNYFVEQAKKFEVDIDIEQDGSSTDD